MGVFRSASTSKGESIKEVVDGGRGGKTVLQNRGSGMTSEGAPMSHLHLCHPIPPSFVEWLSCLGCLQDRDRLNSLSPCGEKGEEGRGGEERVGRGREGRAGLASSHWMRAATSWPTRRVLRTAMV